MLERHQPSPRVGPALVAAALLLWLGACTIAVDLSHLTGGGAAASTTTGGGQGGSGGEAIAGGGSAGDGGGDFCENASECPSTGNPCISPICLNGECGTFLQPPGYVLPPSDQQAGDCQLRVCTAEGGDEQINDDEDEPDDGLCDTRQCISGQVVIEYFPLDTSCGTDQLCNGEGLCVGCNAVADCVPPPDLHPDCYTLVCEANACVVQYASPSKAIAAQAGGDCHEVRCDGTGHAVDVVDDTDVPDDSNDCTEDVCTAGVPSNPDQPENTSCGGDLYCDGLGSCVGCNLAEQCGASTFCAAWACDAGTCVIEYTQQGTALPPGDQVPGDCQVRQCNGLGGVNVVASDSDVPADDGEECTSEQCVSGVPQHPAMPLNTACGGGDLYCDGEGGCVECNSANQCVDPAPECVTATCTAHACGTANVPSGTPTQQQLLGDCKVMVCDGQGGTTNQVQDTDRPVDDNDCTDDVCSGGVPSNPNLPQGTPCTSGGGKACDGAGSCVACTTDSHCLPAEYCSSFQCVPDRAAGQSCTRAAQCLSGYCPPQDGVCCSTACTALCQACVSSKTSVASGTCAKVRDVTDPDDECAGAYLCLYPGCCYNDPELPMPGPQAETPLGPCP